MQSSPPGFVYVFRLGDPHRPSFATIYWEEGRQLPNLTCKKSFFLQWLGCWKQFFRCESGIKTRTSCCWRLNQFLMFFKTWAVFSPFLQGLVGWSVGASCWMSQWKNLPTGTAPHCLLVGKKHGMSGMRLQKHILTTCFFHSESSWWRSQQRRTAPGNSVFSNI